MKIGILSDTHIPTVGESIPLSLLKAFENVDLIIHAGDLVRLEVLDTLTSLAPVKAVYGNMDPAEVKRELPDKLCFSVEGIKIGVIHGWGAPNGLDKRIRPTFPDCNCIIFGHSHSPMYQWTEGVLFLNPGALQTSDFLPQILLPFSTSKKKDWKARLSIFHKIDW